MKSTRVLHSIVCLLLLGAGSGAHAHTGASAGLWSAWVHPLTGLDHLVAMVAVGAWSAQLGGRALWVVPAAFLLAMLVGGLVGFQLVDIAGVEIGVALSVLLLGLAIAVMGRIAVPVAAAAVGIFGFCHGYLHGYELTVVEQRVLAMAAFLSSTALLHLLGLGAAHLALKRPGGERVLRASGALAALFGIWLLVRQLVG